MHDGAVVTTDISSNLSKEKWNEVVKKHLYAKYNQVFGMME